MSRSPLVRMASATLGALLAVSLAACGGTTKDSAPSSGGATGAAGVADPNAQLKTGLKIAFLPKQLNNPYTDIEVGGGKAAVDEVKGEYKLVGPNAASASSQVSYINTLIQQQQDVIVVAANDANAVCTCSSTRRPRRASARSWSRWPAR